MTRNHLVLFELYAGGHNGQYVDNLLRYWVEKGLKGRLDILVPRYFLNAYPSIESFVDRHKEQGLGIVEIDDGEIDFTVRGPIKNHYGQLFTFDRVQRRLLIRYLNRIQPDHCLLMNMDHIQPSLAWSLRFPFALKLSGIYFRPSFHYGTFETGASPRLLTQPIDWIKQVRKTWLLKKALKNPHFESLLCLDPF